jgi:2,3,4,5-tetrahydropyridine-2-carboxylate N-succinyltransferase
MNESPTTAVEFDRFDTVFNGWSAHELETAIELAWAAGPGAVYGSRVHEAVDTVIDALDDGRLRVAQRQAPGQWTVNQWIKKAVLLSFRLHDNKLLRAGDLSFYDKVDSKFAGLDEEHMRASGVRMVPPAVARRGAYLGRNVVMMPSFVNIGAYVDDGTMVDGWANVGSCAQIGRNVHLSVSVCIGGVLEPMQAHPTIVEDNCFIGAHSSVVEGVIVEENSVIDPRSQLWARPCGLGGHPRHAAQPRWELQHGLCGDREEGRCAKPCQDEHQRAVAVIGRGRRTTRPP